VEKRVNFFIAGAQKAGTTALDRMLRRHPALQMAADFAAPEKKKEAHFFDDEAVDWADPDCARLHQYFTWDADVVRGDATPAYLYWPRALDRIHAYNPNARIIVGLRHPVFRAYSHWRMETGRKSDALDFSTAIRSGRARLREHRNGAHLVYSYVERGYYDDQIERLHGLFPPQQLYFFRTDALWHDPERIVGEVQRFLGVAVRPIAGVGYVVPVESEDNERMRADDRALLDAEYTSRYLAIERLTGLDLSDWRDPSYAEPMRPD
jgi:Sulfotransferase family